MKELLAVIDSYDQILTRTKVNINIELANKYFFCLRKNQYFETTTVVTNVTDVNYHIHGTIIFLDKISIVRSLSGIKLNLMSDYVET